jgi:glutamine synthetase
LPTSSQLFFAVAALANCHRLDLVATYSILARQVGSEGHSAIAAFSADPLSEKVMGSLMYKTYIDFKSQEWNDYHNHASDWELQRYLKFF